jgi:hypothetical protein
MLVAILTILVGGLQTAGGAQELIVQGIFNNLRDPLVGGTLGTVAGALTLSAGIALLRESPRAAPLARASAFLTLPVTVLIGFVWGLAGWPMRILGIVFPLFLLVYLRKFPARSPSP